MARAQLGNVHVGKPLSRGAGPFRDGALLAVDAVNTPGDYMAVRKALSQGTTISAEAAADNNVPLRELIVPQKIGV